MRVSGGSQHPPPGERGRLLLVRRQRGSETPGPSPTPGQPRGGLGRPQGRAEAGKAQRAAAAAPRGGAVMHPPLLHPGPGCGPGGRRRWASCRHCRLVAEAAGGPAGSGPAAHRGKVGVLCSGASPCSLPAGLGPHLPHQEGRLPNPTFGEPLTPKSPARGATPGVSRSRVAGFLDNAADH